MGKRLKKLRPVSKKMRKLIPLDGETRLRILERDNYRCRRCGKGGLYSGLLLEVHHVRTRRIPSLRHADDNLVTLCADPFKPNCHGFAHANGTAFRKWWKEAAQRGGVGR